MAKRAALTPDEVERLVSLRERRWTVEAISAELDCSVGSVTWALLREGVDLTPSKVLPPVPTEPVVCLRGGHVIRRYTDADDARLLELVGDGLNVNQISKAIGRRTNSVIGRMRTLARRQARAEHQAAA